MKRMKATGIVLAATLGMLSIASATANAAEFQYSKLGTFHGKALNVQKFKLGKATIECTKIVATGELKRIEFHELPLAVSYEGCSAPGLAGKAVVGTADSSWLLPPGLAIENTVTITAEAFGARCEISIPANQTVGRNTGEVEYQNNSGKLIVKNKIANVAYEITSSNEPSYCGYTGEKGTTGTYTGELEVELVGGTIYVE